MRIQAAVDRPPVVGDTWGDRWDGPDRGLFLCWRRGLQKRVEDQELAARASAGELPVLPWRGGVERAIKASEKPGSLFYLAMWQGLRGEDLDVDLDATVVLTCTRTRQRVSFTPNLLDVLRQQLEANDGTAG